MLEMVSKCVSFSFVPQKKKWDGGGSREGSMGVAGDGAQRVGWRRGVVVGGSLTENYYLSHWAVVICMPKSSYFWSQLSSFFSHLL